MSLHDDPRSLLEDHCSVCQVEIDETSAVIPLCWFCEDTEAAHGMWFELACRTCERDICIKVDDLPLCPTCKATVKADAELST